jgi:hypothetical protein
MRTGRIWIVLGTLILVVLLGFVFVELVRRRQFDVMKTEVEALVQELQAEVAVGSDSALEFCESLAKRCPPPLRREAREFNKLKPGIHLDPLHPSRLGAGPRLSKTSRHGIQRVLTGEER